MLRSGGGFVGGGLIFLQAGWLLKVTWECKCDTVGGGDSRSVSVSVGTGTRHALMLEILRGFWSTCVCVCVVGCRRAERPITGSRPLSASLPQAHARRAALCASVPRALRIDRGVKFGLS